MNRQSVSLTLAALILAGLNMRPLLTSVSPLLGQLRQEISLSPLVASLLPAVPMIMMGVVALLSVSFLQRIALQRLLQAGLLLLLLALLALLLMLYGLVWESD